MNNRFSYTRPPFAYFKKSQRRLTAFHIVEELTFDSLAKASTNTLKQLLSEPTSLRPAILEKYNLEFLELSNFNKAPKNKARIKQFQQKIDFFARHKHRNTSELIERLALNNLLESNDIRAITEILNITASSIPKMNQPEREIALNFLDQIQNKSDEEFRQSALINQLRYNELSLLQGDENDIGDDNQELRVLISALNNLECIKDKSVKDKQKIDDLSKLIVSEKKILLLLAKSEFKEALKQFNIEPSQENRDAIDDSLTFMLNSTKTTICNHSELSELNAAHYWTLSTTCECIIKAFNTVKINSFEDPEEFFENVSKCLRKLERLPIEYQQAKTALLQTQLLCIHASNPSLASHEKIYRLNQAILSAHKLSETQFDHRTYWLLSNAYYQHGIAERKPGINTESQENNLAIALYYVTKINPDTTKESDLKEQIKQQLHIPNTPSPKTLKRKARTSLKRNSSTAKRLKFSPSLFSHTHFVAGELKANNKENDKVHDAIQLL